MDSAILDRCPVGGIQWFMQLTGWSKRKCLRLCSQGIIKGAYRPENRERVQWSFNKEKVRKWFDSIHN